MSTVVPQTGSPVSVASAPRSAASSLSISPANSQRENVALAPPMLQCPPLVTANMCECVPQTKCIQTADPKGPGLATTMLPSAISAVLVVAGWFVVNKAQSNRERRKQIREYVSDLCVDLVELEALAIGYHTTIREEAKEQEIISKLGRLEKACSNLPRFLDSQKYLFKAVKPEKLKMDGRCMQVLRKAMTLNHFGDEHTAALGRQDEYILSLELAAVEMREALECVRIDALD
jgi:hypothetical protein